MLSCNALCVIKEMTIIIIIVIMGLNNYTETYLLVENTKVYDVNGRNTP